MMKGMAASAAALRGPFLRYWLSGFVANFGDGVRLAALPLLAAQLTRSPGGGIATAAGIRATMVIGAVPIASVIIWAWWRHRPPDTP
jgi:hypothetical protein